MKQNIKKVFYAALLLMTPVSLFALSDTCVENQICNPIHSRSIIDLLKNFLDGALTIAIPVVALAIIYSGFLFVFARGNSDKLSKAKTTLMYTLIGAAILLGAMAIAKAISGTITAL